MYRRIKVIFMILLAPIAITVYDRLDHLKNCIDSLLKNPEAKKSVLYIASDAPFQEKDEQKIRDVREYILSITGFKEVIALFWEKNCGGHLSTNLLLKEIFEKYDSFIFIEDDIVVSSDFLRYMNCGLHYYQDAVDIFSICGFKIPFVLPNDYKHNVYFYPCNSPWGFATWKNRWEKINRDYYDRYSEIRKNSDKYKAFTSIGFYIKGILQADSRKEIVAGDLRVYYHMFQHNMCSVFPVVSKTQNWGFDGTGEHCGNKEVWWAKPELDTRNQPTKFIPFTGYNIELLKNHKKFMDKIFGGFWAKWLKYTWVHRLYINVRGRK